MSDKTLILSVIIIPRKSLSEGTSPRITVRITHEIEEILERQDDKSDFIRDAILHFDKFSSSYSLSSRSSKTEQPYGSVNSSLSQDERLEDDDKRVIAYKPAWKR